MAKQAKVTQVKRAGGGKKSAPKKATAKKVEQQPKPAPVRDLGDRFINRAALGYAPTNKAEHRCVSTPSGQALAGRPARKHDA